MSDAISASQMLDPDRPWITREEDMPSKMDWLSTYFNPLGETSKLHFTRAWTLLFFAGLITLMGGGLVIAILGVVGIETEMIGVYHNYFVAAVIGVSALLSFVIHIRRLNHAKKSSLWAMILLLPLLAGAGVMFGGVMQKSGAYQELYESRADYLEDPEAWQEKRLEERRAEQAKAEQERQAAQASGGSARRAAAGQGGGNRQGQRRRRGGGVGPGGDSDEYSADEPLPPKEEFILRPNLPRFYMPIIGLNALIMIWSLTWVARAPSFGREDDTAAPTVANQPFG